MASIKIDSFGPKEITEKQFNSLQLKAKNNFVVIDNYLCKLRFLNRNKTYLIDAISNRITIIKKIYDLDTGEFSIAMRIFNGVKDNEIIFPRDILKKNNISDLLQYGASFNDNNTQDIIDYLLLCDEKAPIENSHIKLGFCDINNKIAFKSSILISTDDTTSTYTGSLELSPKGDINVWIEMIKNEVLGNTPLELALVLGFASPILAFLNTKYDFGSVVFNFSNESSKGKSTAGMLASSVFSRPMIKHGTMINFNSTNNALIKFISDCNAHTVIIDEGGTSVNNDYKNLLYTICSGNDKLRLNTDGALKETQNFSSFIITTAEFDIVDENAPKGIMARAFQINDTFTKSAENSDNIKTTVLRNYGFAGIVFVRHLLEKINVLEEDYIKAKKILIEKVDIVQELTDRIISKFAILLVTASYIKEIFKFDINLEQFSKYLLKLENNIGLKANPEQKLMDIISQFFVSNISRFKNGFKSDLVSNAMGMYEINDRTIKISILKKEFEKFVKSNNLVNYKVILKKLCEKKLLVHEKDRLYKRIRLATKSPLVSCYIFKLDICNDISKTLAEKNYLNNISSEITSEDL